ncbi:MAG TPA: choice-of-anchor P family protein [Actinomycetota bacterium]|nr:choice-of-anchor P family protein [Actinomycetota bacterium]
MQALRFVNLVVAGQPINGNIAPNTAIELPGIGTLWLHRVVVTAYSVEVRMIDLAAVQDNPAELQPGSKLQLAVARALVLP